MNDENLSNMNETKHPKKGRKRYKMIDSSLDKKM
jgi:hypothetical protein